MCSQKTSNMNDKIPDTSLYSLQHVTDDGSSVVYIENISLSESKGLRETLKTIGSVKNFLPLLNKVNKQ